MIYKPPGPHVNTCYLYQQWITLSKMDTQFVALTPYENFLYALKATESRRQYPHRLDKFLTFMEFQRSIEERCQKLYAFSKNNFEQLQSFINSQKKSNKHN